MSSKLDWNRMLGFEQVADTRLAASAKLGAKVGDKGGATIGAKLGAKIGDKGGSPA
jgi:hypothetical protein